MSEPTASSTAVTVSSPTLTLRCAELAADEVGPLGALVIRAHGCTCAPSFLQLIGQRLGAPAAGVHHHQHRALRQVRGGRGDQRDGVLARLGGRLEHDDPLVGEQRRAEQFGEFVGADLARAQPVHRDVVGARRRARGPQHRRRRRARRAALRHPGPGAGLGSRADGVTTDRQRPRPARRPGQQPSARRHASRPHRQRHSTTTPRPAAPRTSTRPPRRHGHGRAGTPPPSAPRCSSHHSSGPVNRISSSAPAGQSRRQRRRGGADHRDRRDHRGHRQIRRDRHQAHRARDPRHQRRRDQLRGDRDADRVRQRFRPAARRRAAATTPAR